MDYIRGIPKTQFELFIVSRDIYQTFEKAYESIEKQAGDCDIFEEESDLLHVTYAWYRQYGTHFLRRSATINACLFTYECDTPLISNGRDFLWNYEDKKGVLQ